MPPSAYPMPASGGPPYLKFLQLPNQYPSVMVKEMDDGGATYGASSSNKVIAWEITYDGLTDSQAATIDTHHDSAIDKLLGFGFTDPRTSTVYTDVHYREFDRNHTKIWSHSRRVVLEKRPA